MQNREFIDSSDDVEKLVAKQNEMTVLDESIAEALIDMYE